MAGPKTRDTLEGKTVQELQSLAVEAANAPPALPRRGLSRAARLHLVDQLSRWGGSGLAMVAGVAIFLMIVVARETPVRSALWAAILFAALYLCRRYRKEFRRGDRIASRPFRWRAYYTSTIAVVSAAFGAGAFLLVPKGLTGFGAMETMSLMLLTTGVAAALHAAHRPTAMAAALPALAAIAGASFTRIGPGPFSFFILLAGAACVVILALMASETARRAASRFPRTSFIRREVEKSVAGGATARVLTGARAAAT